jgi:hypothetical protein
MKYAIIIPDGCADEPQSSLSGKTPLQAAHTPLMDEVARLGVVGRSNNVPPHLPADAALHVSGSLALAVPALGDTIEARLRRGGAQPLIKGDPNPRPALNTHPAAARGPLGPRLGLADPVNFTSAWTTVRPPAGADLQGAVFTASTRHPVVVGPADSATLPTSGGFSDVIARELPNGWLYFVSIGDFRNAEGKSEEGKGIVPAITSTNTKEDIDNGKDKVLELAIAKLN